MYQKLNMALTKYVFNFFPSISCAFAALWLSITMKRQWKEPFAVAGTYLFSLLFLFQQ